MALGNNSTPFYPHGFPSEKNSNLNIRCFGNRFRVANALAHIEFKSGMNPETGKGYSDLIHVTLAYSAYEQFRKPFGLAKHNRREGIEANYREDPDYIAIRTASVKCDQMLARLQKCDEIKDGLVTNIKHLKDNKDFSIFLLAEAIRHGFVHGELTPNAFNSDPRNVSELCAAVARLTIRIMDAEFEKLFKQWQVGEKKRAERKRS